MFVNFCVSGILVNGDHRFSKNISVNFTFAFVDKNKPYV